MPDKKIKIHLGCGAVYLEGYDNVDVPEGEYYLAKERPDLAEENLTTLTPYYKSPYYNNFYERFRLRLQGAKSIPPPKGTPSKNKKRKKTVIDKAGYAHRLPYKKGTVDEIRCVQVFEHLSPEEAQKALTYWRELLRPGGKVVIDVPEIIETAKLMATAETEEERHWAEKLIYGTRNNSFAYHKVGYWPEKLKGLLKKVGFSNIKIGENMHSYPAFSIEATK